MVSNYLNVKRLLIIRHAKSSWDNPELTDFDRPLNKRGKRDLPDMALRLSSLNLKIDHFLSSPANRALITAVGHAQLFGLSKSDIQTDKRLFHASVSRIMQVISETPNQFDTLAIFGHNPGLTGLINQISDFELWNLPTCAICGIEFSFDSWGQIISGKGTKFYYDYPKSRFKE